MLCSLPWAIAVNILFLEFLSNKGFSINYPIGAYYFKSALCSVQIKKKILSREKNSKQMRQISWQFFFSFCYLVFPTPNHFLYKLLIIDTGRYKIQEHTLLALLIKPRNF